MKGVNVASITNTKRCNAVMIRVLPYPSDLLRGHIQDVTPHAAAGQSRTLLGSPCAAHCHHEKGHPKISTELAGELFCTAPISAVSSTLQVCLVSHGQPFLHNNATGSQFTKCRDGSWCELWLLVSSSIHYLLLDDIDERVVSLKLVGSGSVNGRCWFFLHRLDIE